MDSIVQRITRTLGLELGHAPLAGADLVGRLAALPGSDLQSLWLAVVRARAATVTPTALNAAADRGGAVAPSTVDARLFNALDAAAFAAAPDAEAVELSPVAPIGLDALLGGISPNNVLATVRNSQLLADPTTALALECARRRRRDRNRETLRLCAAARMMRLQPLPAGDKHLSRHFRLFGMVTAGRDEGSFGFELRTLREHLTVYLRLAGALAPLGIAIRGVEVVVSDTDVVRGLLGAGGIDGAELAGLVHGHDADAGAPTLAARGITLPRDLDLDLDLAAIDALDRGDRAARAGRRRLIAVSRDVFAPLAHDFPTARFRLDGARLAGLGYYRGLTLQIWLTTADGASFPVGDGGFTTWTQTLLGDHKERLLTSGLGLELLARRFRA